MQGKVYIACDLKSFYASVECIERDLDPLTTNLVVADAGRTEKTICLAVSPALKAYGISGRARLFEVVQKVAEVNALRKRNATGRQFIGSSWHDPDVKSHPELLIDHAWGYEPVTMADIKAYKPEAKSVGSGQVLACPYDFDKPDEK